MYITGRNHQMLTPASMHTAQTIKPPLRRLQAGHCFQCVFRLQLFFAVGRPARDRRFEVIGKKPHAAITRKGGEMGIGRAGHLEIKLAVKLATQQVSKVMRQSFQLSFASPKQAPELFTQRQQNCRHNPLRQILLVDLIYTTKNESFKGID